MGCSDSTLKRTVTGFGGSETDAGLTRGHMMDLNMEHSDAIAAAIHDAEREVDVAKTRSVWDFYDADTSLVGRGAFARVFKGTRKADQQIVAIKVISRGNKNFAQSRSAMAMKIACMRQLQGHTCMIKLHEVFEDAEGYHVVVEYCAGGAIFDQIVKKGHFTEHDAAIVLHQLLDFVAYMHRHNVVHRDLKPENLMLLDEEGEGGTPSLALRVIDFGTAAFCEMGQHLHSKIGTARYVAPEVLARDYDAASDVWSIGVIAYTLLSGHCPFQGRSDTGTLAQVKAGTYDFAGEEWTGVSHAAKDLISHMLVVDPEARYTAEQLLEHPWFQTVVDEPAVPLAGAYIERLHGFVGMCRMKRLALKLMAHDVADEVASFSFEAHQLKDVFASLDADGDGLIDGAALTAGLARVGIQLPTEDVQEFMKIAGVDTHGRGIDWEEFLAAMFDAERAVRRPAVLRREFEALDTDHDGFITPADLVAAEESTSDPITLEEAEAILREAVPSGHLCRLNLEEFTEMMVNSPSGRLLSSKGTITPPRVTTPTKARQAANGGKTPGGRDDTAKAALGVA